MSYKQLLLKNQLCFPLYAASREVVKKYKPYLDKIGLTYTQYIVMLVLWEEEVINVKEMGKLLLLESGPLTPLLKKLETEEIINRTRSNSDERNLEISLTSKGKSLKEKAKTIPGEVGKCIDLSLEEAVELQRLLNKIIESK